MTSPEYKSLAEQIRTDHARRANGENEWRIGTFDLCVHLAQARARFNDDNKLHDWLVANKLDVLNKDDRAAAINMGLQPEITKAVLDKTESRSLQLIHRREFRGVLSAKNPPKPSVTTKKDGTPRKKAGPQSRRGKETPKLDLAREIVRAKLDANEPISPHKLQDEHGVSHVTFDMAITAELARKEAEADPPIDASTLSISSQEKLEAARRQWLKAWEREKKELIRIAALELIEEHLLPHYREKFERAERIDKMLSKRKGYMTDKEFMTILSCLHPDNSASASKRNEAFRLFNDLKDFLVIDKDRVTSVGPTTFPRTYEEMMAMRDAATAARKAAYAVRKNGANVRPR